MPSDRWVRKMKKARIIGLAAFLAAVQLATGCAAGKEENCQSPAAGKETDLESPAAGKETDHEELVDGRETGSKSPADKKEGDSQVASQDEMAEAKEVLEEGMVPIEGMELKDGIYEVTVDSSSSMFRITRCSLTVSEGKMTAVMTMGGTGYLKVFLGTGEEAVNAMESDYIPFAENENGEHTFEIPVAALDAEIACTAFSKNKEKWYDRTLVFRADSLPLIAFADGTAVTAETLGLADGQYLIDAELKGGSGKAGVESPALLRIENGQAYATIVFSSPNYDYMKIGEEKYLPVNTEGNSSFEIPVSGFDRDLSVIADTIAMSEPHEITYALRFDSSSIKKAEE